METKKRNIKRYIFGTLAVLLILAWGWWGLGNSPSFAGKLESSTFQVVGISCSACLPPIREALFKQQGMVEMKADLDRGLLRIEHRPPLSEETIVRVLGDLGYPAKAVPEQVASAGGEAAAKGCSGCGPRGCSATAASWGELGRKIFGIGKP
ncbi:MAG: heavy metal-associated domain-containing protein [Desulfurivibrionaceae bacterium]